MRTPPRTVVLAGSVVAASFLALSGVVLAGLLLAGPAAAEVPEGWPENESVSLLNALLLIGGVTLLVLLVITVIVVGPALARGESLAPGVTKVEDQWLGGPRKPAGELAAADDSGSESASTAGGAGARW